MRIKMAAIAAGVMVAVAGCASGAQEAPPAATSAVATPTPTPIGQIELQALMDNQGSRLYPDDGAAARFVGRWWETLPAEKQSLVCSQWTGMNVKHMLRYHVSSEWGNFSGMWDTPPVRLEMISTLDEACS